MGHLIGRRRDLLLKAGELGLLERDDSQKVAADFQPDGLNRRQKQWDHTRNRWEFRRCVRADFKSDCFHSRKLKKR